MSQSIQDDTTSWSEDETILTPSSASPASCNDTEPNWLFQGTIFDRADQDYSPFSAPALAVHRGQLWCLWISSVKGHYFPLCWTSLNSNGKWKKVQKVLVGWRACEETLSAVGRPAVADLNGTLHLVLIERNQDPRSLESPPLSRLALVHFQYDDVCQSWGKRASLGVSSGPEISLKGYAGQLYCAYTDSCQNLCYATWSEITGWSRGEVVGKTQCTNRGFAFYTSRDTLHLLCASGMGKEWNIQDSEYQEDACCWYLPQSPVRVEGPIYGGLDVASFEGRAYVISRDNGRRPVLMRTYSKDQWTAAEEIHDKPGWKVPATATFDGTLSCVWTGGSGRHRELMWSQRLMTPSISMEKWMSRIDSDVYLSELSIPGSHESCATIAVPWVQCQYMSIDDQLRSGVRYFDFRCGVLFGRLYLFHGRSPLGFALHDVLATMYTWLERVEKEALIVQIKMEGGTGDESTFEALFRDEITQHGKYWALGNTIPRLDATRGKIQLMRRFHIANGILGIDVRRWADNSSKFTIALEEHESLVVQDRYEYTDAVPSFAELVQTKASAVDALIAAARDNKNRRTWFLNWSNAYALPHSLGVIATPADIAIGRHDVVGRRRQFISGVNSFLAKKSFLGSVKGRFGTILLDFAETPDPDLVAAIVRTNTFQIIT